MTDYFDFINRKHKVHEDTGFTCRELPAALRDWQADVVAWALRKGRAAMFEDCGLGKTLQQLAWADAVHRHTNGDVLILAPLAVAPQTVAEGAKFGIPVAMAREARDIRPGVNVVNYERLHLFDPGRFTGVVLDESSILKAFMGRTKRALVDAFNCTPYRLCCTATPAPNDVVELGNHAEFLGVMDPGDMLTRFFINDTSTANKLRLKKHAVRPFWEWVSSWAICMTSPADLGYPADGYELPPIHLRKHVVAAPEHDFSNGKLMAEHSYSATDMHREMRETLKARAAVAAGICRDEHGGEPVIAWCNTNDEAEGVVRQVPGAREVRGNMRPELKEELLTAFTRGELRALVTKPSIAGFGLNWQHCRASVSVGLSYSFEQRYQALRRIWRFGQTREVFDHVCMGPGEAKIFDSVMAKQAAHEDMGRQMAMSVDSATALGRSRERLELDEYRPERGMLLPGFLASAPAASGMGVRA